MYEYEHQYLCRYLQQYDTLVSMRPSLVRRFFRKEATRACHFVYPNSENKYVPGTKLPGALSTSTTRIMLRDLPPAFTTILVVHSMHNRSGYRSGGVYFSSYMYFMTLLHMSRQIRNPYTPLSQLRTRHTAAVI